jgi:Glycosyltransferase family 87
LRLSLRSRNLAYAGLAYLLIAVIGVSFYWVFRPVFIDPLDQDTVFVVMGARIGLEQGWTHLYSFSLQQQYYAMMRPGAEFDQLARYLHPPPFAVMFIPLTLIPLPVVFWIFFAIDLAALLTCWYVLAPGNGFTVPKVVLLLATLAWYPVLFELREGQPVMLVVLAVTGCWYFAQAGRPWLAGVALALSVLKPQLVFWLPACLLLAGQWRIAAGWAATAAVLALGSLALVGQQGLHDYLSLLDFARSIVFNRYFTLAYIFGPGPATTVAQSVVVAAGLFAAYRMRNESLDRIMALGIVTSMLAIPYDHVHDFAVLVPAIYLFLRTNPPGWRRAWLLVLWISIELMWPATPLPLLLSQIGWLVLIALPAFKSTAKREPVAAAAT